VKIAVLIGTLFLALVAHPATAQLTGRVMTETGLPLQGVSMEAWNDGGKIMVRLTDDAGLFSFPDSVAAEATVLWAARLGFRPQRVSTESGVTHYEIRLVEEAVSVQGVVVEAPREVCDGREDDEARYIWQRLRARYHPALDTLGVATYMVWAEAFVPLDDIGPLDLPAVAIEQRGSSSQLRFAWNRRVARRGYAFPTRRVENGEAHDSWVYAPIDADFAPHLIDETFGELHDFQMLNADDQGWEVAFCPNDDDHPMIQGTLTISPDTTLTGAEWRFETPEPKENAGGRAVFFPVTAPPEESYLLPAEAVFWRKVSLDQYYQRYQRYEGWVVAHGDSVPTLPTRRKEDLDDPVEPPPLSRLR
jgi:hypothetical protein